MSSTPDPDSFRVAMLHFVNEVLPGLDARSSDGPPPERIEAGTLLFETNRLDSLSILHLIAAIEELTGEPVPDARVTMKHFRSIETITATFCHERPLS
jgi:acyl carrier protein